MMRCVWHGRQSGTEYEWSATICCMGGQTDRKSVSCGLVMIDDRPCLRLSCASYLDRTIMFEAESPGCAGPSITYCGCGMTTVDWSLKVDSSHSSVFHSAIYKTGRLRRTVTLGRGWRKRQMKMQGQAMHKHGRKCCSDSSHETR